MAQQTVFRVRTNQNRGLISASCSTRAILEQRLKAEGFFVTDNRNRWLKPGGVTATISEEVVEGQTADSPG